VHWDKLNFDRGINTPPEQYRLSEWTSDAEWQVARRNMRRFVREIMRIPGVSGRTHAELAALAEPPPSKVTPSELQVRARLAGRDGISTEDPLLSPAELLYLWALWLDEGRPEGPLPWRYVEGPTEEAVPTPSLLALGTAVARQAAGALRREVERSGRLPANVTTAGATLGIGTVFTVLARLVSGEEGEALQVPLSPQVPAIGNLLASEVKHHVPGWLHKPDLDVSRHCAYTRLQSWTLKPALFR
jgi:hypothetical protein